MIKIIDARFVTTAVEPKGYPTGHAAEVAFVGRSNVGKSSMINALTGRKKLVRVSNTPGRTRTLNFFDVELERDGVRHAVRLADLPGYGFAKASKTERAQWETMITTYLEKRHRLEAVVSIIDAEVGPTPDDIHTLDYLQEQRPAHPGRGHEDRPADQGAAQAPPAGARRRSCRCPARPCWPSPPRRSWAWTRSGTRCSDVIGGTRCSPSAAPGRLCVGHPPPCPRTARAMEDAQLARQQLRRQLAPLPPGSGWTR